MTVSHIKRFVKPLLEHNPEFGQCHRIIALKPIRHVLRCVYFNTSSQRDYPVLYWMIRPLFEHHVPGMSPYNAEIHSKLTERKSWRFSDETAPEDFANCVKGQVLPIL